MARVSYILPVWITTQEVFELTKKAISSFKNADTQAELVIIDNASTLGKEYLQEEATLYIRNKLNMGFATAVRQGWLLASGEILATVNNDIRVASNWLEVCEPLLNDPIVGIVHPRMTDYDKPFEYGKSVVYRGKERWCTFSFFVLKKAFLGQLAAIENSQEPYPGVLDLNYKYNSADWDFCHRVRKAGFRQVYTDKTSYQHKHSSTQILLHNRETIENDNREYFKHKWGEYPEIIFAQEFPDQVQQNYQEGFEI